MSASSSPTSEAPRRDFLRAAARWSALGGLGAVAAILARRGVGGGSSDCRGTGVCAGCAFAQGCTSPRLQPGTDPERR